ncbi:MAG: TolC family protein [Spirochaetales bacterium]|uniref:TolC family protein n=1 Tax=Candidatus Thalassospirochaeta sargassi TaxID=3119039 RepID=A0AAJ1II48_9SPIO|nr:TolC family protein [Spirochaetales bacterium]
MKKYKVISAVMFSAAIFASEASADTINTIEQVEETALLNNLDYKTAVLEVMEAGNALEGWIKLDDSSLTLSGSYDGSSAEYGWGASATLPVFDQLSFDASVDEDDDEGIEGSFTVNISPFNHTITAAESRLNYTLKLAAAENTAREVSDNAVESYLDWVYAAADYDILQKTAEVNQILYEDEKIRFEAGESVLDDVREAFSDWSEARTAANNALNRLQTAETGLYTTLNIDPADFNIEAPVEADLFNLIEKIDAEIDDTKLSISGSYNILSAEAAAEMLQLQLDNTWAFQPDLEFSGSMDISADDLQPDFSAGVSLTLALDDWNYEERELLSTELEISLSQAVQTVYSEQLNLNQALTTAESAAINYELAEVELEQAEELLDEAEFLFELGEYSEAELEETALQYETSRNGLFSAAAERYNALRALAEYSN